MVWMDSYPLLDALGFHSARTRSNTVNFLAANVQIPEVQFQGSGICSPTGADLDFCYNRYFSLQTDFNVKGS